MLGIYILLAAIFIAQICIIFKPEYKFKPLKDYTPPLNLPDSISNLFNNYKQNKEKQEDIGNFVEGLNNLMNYNGEPQGDGDK